MRKIAYVTKELSINGISEVIFNYCRNLSKEKYSITIFSGPPIDRKYLEEAKNLGVTIIETPPKRGKNPFKYYKFLKKKLIHKDYDIVHIHGSSATITLELIIAKINKIKIKVAHSHNTKCDKLFIHRLLKPILKYNCDYMLACGNEAGKWMFEKRKFEVVNNGIDFNKYKFNLEVRKRIRESLNIGENFVLGHIGTFNAQKNQSFLIELMNHLKEYKEIKLILIGDGPLYTEVNKKIIENGLENNIILLGNKKDAYKYYNAMDYFLLPSLFEGLPLVLVEAQVNGIDCLVSDNISIEANITKKIEFQSIDNIEIWKDIILKKYKDKIERKNVNIWDDKIKMYDVTNVIGQIEKIYGI